MPRSGNLVSEASSEVPSAPLELQCFQKCDEADAYISECRRLSVPIDASIVVALQFACDTVQISSNNSFEGCLLPLYPVLAHSKVIRRMNLYVTSHWRYCGTGNSNAKVLGEVLAINTSLVCLDLRYTGIDEVGMIDLCSGLKRNRTLKQLFLKGNYLGPGGGQALAELLQQSGPSQLIHIDVTFCGIGCTVSRKLAELAGVKAGDGAVPHNRRTVKALAPAAEQVDIRPMIWVTGNFVTEEVWNAVTHGIGLIASVVGAFLLISGVSAGPVHHIWGAVLYAVSLMFMFLSSTLYHSLFLLESAHSWFQMLDHISIFTLISGHYSALFLFYPLEGHLQVLMAEWWICLFGIIMHVISQYYAWGKSTLYCTLELVLYVTMGLGCMTIWESLSALLTPYARDTLVAGGLLYLAGVPFFVFGDYYPICHTIWHIFVLSASIFMWFSLRASSFDAQEKHINGRFDKDIQVILDDAAQVKRCVADAWQYTAQQAGKLTSSLPPVESLTHSLLLGSLAAQANTTWAQHLEDTLAKLVKESVPSAFGSIQG